jgi:hypothetical protein
MGRVSLEARTGGSLARFTYAVSDAGTCRRGGESRSDAESRSGTNVCASSAKGNQVTGFDALFVGAAVLEFACLVALGIAAVQIRASALRGVSLVAPSRAIATALSRRFAALGKRWFGRGVNTTNRWRGVARRTLARWRSTRKALHALRGPSRQLAGLLKAVTQMFIQAGPGGARRSQPVPALLPRLLRLGRAVRAARDTTSRESSGR